MAAIGMVQMLIEAAEYLDRRERGKAWSNACVCVHFRVFVFCYEDNEVCSVHANEKKALRHLNK